MRSTSAAGTPWPAIVKKPMSVQAASTARTTASRSSGRAGSARGSKGAMSMTGTVVCTVARPA